MGEACYEQHAHEHSQHEWSPLGQDGVDGVGVGSTGDNLFQQRRTVKLAVLFMAFHHLV